MADLLGPDDPPDPRDRKAVLAYIRAKRLNPDAPSTANPKHVLDFVRAQRAARTATAQATFEPLTGRAPSMPGLAESAEAAAAPTPVVNRAPGGVVSRRNMTATAQQGQERMESELTELERRALADRSKALNFSLGVGKGLGGFFSQTLGGLLPAEMNDRALAALEEAAPSGGGADIAGRLVGNMAPYTLPYGMLTRAAAARPAGTVAEIVARNINSPNLLPRIGANILTGAPLDVATGLIEANQMRGQKDPIRLWMEEKGLVRPETNAALFAVGRNLAFGAVGATAFEGARQPFQGRPPRPTAVPPVSGAASADQAARIVETAPVITEGERLAQARIAANPDPIAEARAANPLTDTDPARESARTIEASAGPALPPSVYRGVERRNLLDRLPDTPASDIINRHRRATDLPPVEAPLAPRQQSGAPRGGTTTAATGPVTFTEFPSRDRVVASEEAILERLALDERSAESELAARSLGAPPQMEGARPMRLVPKRGGGIKWEGGHKGFETTPTQELIARHAEVLARIDAANGTISSKVKQWTRFDDDIQEQRAGTSVPAEAGRALGALKRDAVFLSKVEEELAGRGVDLDELRQSSHAANQAQRAATRMLPEGYFDEASGEGGPGKVQEPKRPPRTKKNADNYFGQSIADLQRRADAEGIEARAAGLREPVVSLASDPEVNVRLIPDAELDAMWRDAVDLRNQWILSGGKVEGIPEERMDRIIEDAGILSQERTRRQGGGTGMVREPDPLQRSLFTPPPADQTTPSAPTPAPKRASKRIPMPEDAVQAIQKAEESFAARTVAVSRRTQQLGAEVIRTPDDLARATAYLGQGAHERLDAVLVDAGGKPIAVLGGFKGGPEWAAAPTQTILAEAFQTPGGKAIWMVHNHPSGRSDLSDADRQVSTVLERAFRGSGIEYKGAMAIGGGAVGDQRRWSYRTPQGDESSGYVGAVGRGPTVPMMEREFVKHGSFPGSDNIDNSAKATAAMAQYSGGQDGVLLLNSQRLPIGFIPLTPEVAGKLRGQGRSDAVYRAIGVSNATAAIIHAPTLSQVEVNNLAGLLKGADVEPLDVIGGGARVRELRPTKDWGRTTPEAISPVAGAGVGSVVGAATGDTPEERRRNALLGAGIGAAAGAGLASVRGERGALGVPGGPGFTSRLHRAAKGAKIEKAPFQTWVSKLRGRESSADEFDWAFRNLSEADRKRTWTRAEIEAHVAANGYGALTETVRGGDQNLPVYTIQPDPNGYRVTDAEGAHPVVFGEHEMDVARAFRNELSGTDVRELRRLSRAYEKSAKMLQSRNDPEARQMFDMAVALEARADNLELGRGGATRYSQYTEPGGTNYREILVQVPAGPSPAQERAARVADLERRLRDGSGITEAEYAERVRLLEGGEYTPKGPQPFQSAHWDEPNVLAHIRMNDRVGPNGEKILHVEEIQSDWHQKGRKQGYRGALGREQKGWKAIPPTRYGPNRGLWTVVDGQGREVGVAPAATQGEAIMAIAENRYGVPNAPFKETPEWLGLAMKRVLDEAVAGGYDAVSWTPGIKQADRYSLRKVADEVIYERVTGDLTVSHNGQIVHSGQYDPKALPDVIGKEAADRLLATPVETSGTFRNGAHILRDQQLEIGGEGMQVFYDQMLPDWVRGYAKKLGVRLDVAHGDMVSPGAKATGAHRDAILRALAASNNPDHQVIATALLRFRKEGVPWKDLGDRFALSLERGLVDPTVRNRILADVEAGRWPEGLAQRFPQFAITPELRAAIGKGQNYGKGGLEAMGGVTGAGTGALAGAATGDTPEERKRRALLGALAGAGAGAGLGYAASRIGIRYGPAVRDAASRTYQALLNDVHAADEFGRRVGRTEDVAYATATARGWRGRAEWYIGKRGPTVGGPLTLRQVMLSAKGVEEQVRALATYRHALELEAAGMADKGVDLALARQNIPLLEADPRVKAAADELHAFYRRLLDDRLANGLLDQAQYDAIIARGDYYVPFVREWSVEQRAGGTGGGKLFNRSSGVRRMNPKEVASSAIVDPFEQAVRDAQSTARDILRQRVMNTVGDILTAHPTEAAPYLVDHGPMHGTPPLHASIQERVITPVINGVKHRVEVTDPDLFAALQSAAPASQSIFKKILVGMKGALQTGVTMAPEFGIANATRDAFFSSMQYHFPKASAAASTAVGAGVGAAVDSEDRLRGAAIGAGLGLGAGVMAPHLLRTVQGLSHVLKYDNLYQDWLKEGGSGMGMYAQTPAEARRMVRSLTAQHGPLTILNPKSWWDGLVFVNGAIEQAPRVARFADQLQRGASPVRASASSRDISVDFGRKGGDPMVRGMADVTAFWNPNIQGLDKVRRTLFGKGSAKAWAMGAATMTAPSLALFAINKDDQSYWDRPLWERNLFWLVPAGTLENGDTRFIRVPKPFEPGYVFASIPERLAEFAYQRDPERTGAALRDMLGKTASAFFPVPTGIKPVAEAAVNYDTFRRRPIVPQGIDQLPASRQTLPQTSVAARAAGAAGEAVGLPVSPLKVDHLIRGLTGPLGAEALEAVIDPLARLTGLDRGPKPPARPLVEWSRFVTKPNGFGTDDVQTMFRRFDRAERWHTDISRRVKANDRSAIAAAQAHQEDLVLYEQLKPYVEQFRELSAARRSVVASRTMTPAEKRAKLLQLGELAAGLATRAVNGIHGQTTGRVDATDRPRTVPLGGR